MLRVLSSGSEPEIRTKAVGRVIWDKKWVSGSASPRDRNEVENGGRKDAPFFPALISGRQPAVTRHTAHGDSVSA